MKALMALRDMGTVPYVVGTAKALRARGHEVVIYAEADGQAGKKLGSEGVMHTVFLPATQVARIVRDESPDVVITGFGSPRVKENSFDLFAVTNEIPLVHLEDFWNVHTRSKFAPDLTITIHKSAADLLRLINRKVVVAGFAATPPSPRMDIVDRFEAVREMGKKVIVFTDGGPQCGPGLELLINCLAQTDAPYVLVPKFHPKFVSQPMPNSKITWGEYWEDLLVPLRGNRTVCYMSEPTPDLVVAADMTFSSYSTLLLTAGMAGRGVCTLWTPEAKNFLYEEAKLQFSPLMSMDGYPNAVEGRWPVITHPQPLDEILSRKQPALDLKPFDGNIAAEAILNLVK